MTLCEQFDELEQAVEAAQANGYELEESDRVTIDRVRQYLEDQHAIAMRALALMQEYNRNRAVTDAAPELLAAIKGVIEAWDDPYNHLDGDEIDKARELVARLTPQSARD